MLYVMDLSEDKQARIKKELYKAVEEMGLYNSKEVEELVVRGMESKLTDLSDTIDISKYK